MPCRLAFAFAVVLLAATPVLAQSPPGDSSSPTRWRSRIIRFSPSHVHVVREPSAVVLTALLVRASVRSDELPAADATSVNGQSPDCRAGGWTGFDPARAVVLPHVGERLRLRLWSPLCLSPSVHFRRLSEAHHRHLGWSGRSHARSRDLDSFDCTIGRSHFDEAVAGREAHGPEVPPRGRSHGSLHSGQYDPA